MLADMNLMDIFCCRILCGWCPWSPLHLNVSMPSEPFSAFQLVGRPFFVQIKTCETCSKFLLQLTASTA